ncbi:MAG: hypothetical protein NZ578_08505 [Candidatus Binatia bacterium]|nr:hypothetical protein [Candidatus Binatia bacterium]
MWLGNADDGTAGPDNYPYNGIIFAVFLYRRRLTDYDIGVFNRYPLAPLMLRSPSVLGRMVVISTDLGVSSDSPLFAVYGQRHSHSLGTTSHDTPAFRLAASSPFPMLSAVADLIARSFPVPIISVPHGIQTSSDYRAQLLLRPVDTQSGQASMSLPAPVWRVVSSVPLEVAGGETRTLRLSGASAFPMALAVDAASGAFLRTAHSLGLVQSVSSIHEATVRAVYSAAMPAVVGALTPAMLQVLVGAFPFASAQSIVAAASSSAALSLPHQTTGDLGASAQLSERFSLPHQTTGDLGASAGLAEHLSLLAGTQLSSSHALSMSERSSILLDHSTAIAPGAALTMALSGSFTSQAALIVDVTVEETIAHVLVLLGCHAALSPLHSVAQVYSAAFVADAMAASLIFARPQIQAHPGGVSAAIAQVVSLVHTIQGLLAVQTDLSPALLARLSSAFSEFAAATMSLSAAVGERVALSLSGAVGEGSKVASSLAGTLVLATGTALEPAVREAIVQHLTAVVQSALSESERHILRQAEALGVSADQAQSIARLAVLFAAASVQTTLQSLAFGILPNVPSMLRVVQERVLQGVIGEEAVRRAGLAHEAVRRAGMVDEEPQG